MMENFRYEHLLIFVFFMASAWFIVICFLPRMLLSVFKRAILVKGFGDGPIPINTLYTQSQESFADPLRASGSNLMTTGVNRDTLLTIGWLDLRRGPQILNVPDMAERYYSVELIDPTKNIGFAYVGKRATGNEAGAYLISGPKWRNSLPCGMSQIVSPTDSVLVVGRVLVESGSDLPAAYKLTKQIEISSLSKR